EQRNWSRNKWIGPAGYPLDKNHPIQGFRTPGWGPRSPPACLLGRTDNGGDDDLAPTRDVALGIEMAMEAVEQRLDQTGLGQRLPKQPHRGRIWYRTFQAKAQKAHER